MIGKRSNIFFTNQIRNNALFLKEINDVLKMCSFRFGGGLQVKEGRILIFIEERIVGNGGEIISSLQTKKLNQKMMCQKMSAVHRYSCAKCVNPSNNSHYSRQNCNRGRVRVGAQVPVELAVSMHVPAQLVTQ